MPVGFAERVVLLGAVCAVGACTSDNSTVEGDLAALTLASGRATGAYDSQHGDVERAGWGLGEVDAVEVEGAARELGHALHDVARLAGAPAISVAMPQPFAPGIRLTRQKLVPVRNRASASTRANA